MLKNTFKNALLGNSDFFLNQLQILLMLKNTCNGIIPIYLFFQSVGMLFMLKITHEKKQFCTGQYNLFTKARDIQFFLLLIHSISNRVWY